MVAVEAVAADNIIEVVIFTFWQEAENAAVRFSDNGSVFCFPFFDALGVKWGSA